MRLGEAALSGVGMGAGAALAVCSALAAPPSPTAALTPSPAPTTTTAPAPTTLPAPVPSTVPATAPAPTTAPVTTLPGTTTSPAPAGKAAPGAKALPAPIPGATAPAAVAPPPPALAPNAPLPPWSEVRPPLPPEPEREPVVWQHHIEVGGGVAVTEMPASVDGDGKPTPVRFKPGVGFHIDLSWQVWRYLRFTGYLVERNNDLQLSPGVLGVPGTISPASAHVYTFGVRFSPTLPLSPRARLWLTAGAGWGYFGYDRMTVDETSACSAASTCVTLPARSATVFEIPLGLGGAFEIIPHWLSVHLEVTGAFMPSQIGDALGHMQYIGADQMEHDLGPMPKVDAAFVETLGLSVHL